MQKTGGTLSLGNNADVAGPGADINTPAAWEISTGSSSIVLAMLDSGIAMNHPNFSGKLVAGTNHVTPNSDPAESARCSKKKKSRLQRRLFKNSFLPGDDYLELADFWDS